MDGFVRFWTYKMTINWLFYVKYITFYFLGMTIFGTSLFGGAVLTASMDYFVEKFLMASWIWEKVMLKRNIQPCWLSWILLGVWPALTLTGLIIQCALTGRGTYHEKSKYWISPQSRMDSQTDCPNNQYTHPGSPCRLSSQPDKR